MGPVERRQECRIVSLDIRGAFDSVWWGGLLQHLWSVGLRGKAYYLLCSYLCDRDLFVPMETPHLGGYSQPGCLRVAFGLPYCLICTFVIFQLRFYTVPSFSMLTIQLL